MAASSPTGKGSAELGQMDPECMAIYRKLCGWTLARAHARTGDRVAIPSYLANGAKLDRAILEFSGAYGEQKERDYQQVVEAVSSGRVVAQIGLSPHCRPMTRRRLSASHARRSSRPMPALSPVPMR